MLLLFTQENRTMLVQSILKRIQKQPGFVYEHVRWAGPGKELGLEVRLRAYKRSLPICSSCFKKCKGYDRLRERRFVFVPLLNIPMNFVYAPRRCACPRCGVTVEALPWAEGKSRHTTTYLWFLASWAKSLSWTETARRFGSSWAVVFKAVEMAVIWGRAHADYRNISSIGVDEFAWKKRHKFLTLVYQIDIGMTRLLWMGESRKAETFAAFFTWFRDNGSILKFITSDMWAAFLKVASAHAPSAVHVLDRFHVMALFSKAIDKVRRDDVAKLRKAGDKVTLTNTRWILLKQKRNLTGGQMERLGVLLRANLRVVKMYLLRESFQKFWDYVSPHWADRFLLSWLREAGRKRIRPLRTLVKTLTKHRPLLLNWFRAKGAFKKGATEGMNGKARVTTKRAYGFKSFRHAEIALFHALGELPTPDWHTHRFA